MSLKTNSRHVSNLVRMDFLTMQLFKHILHRETSNCETDVGDNRGTPTIVDSKESVPYQQWLIWKVNLGSPLGSRSPCCQHKPIPQSFVNLGCQGLQGVPNPVASYGFPLPAALQGPSAPSSGLEDWNYLYYDLLLL